jgi:nitroreductase
MNAVIEAVKGRRSVRSYQERPVPRELVEAIIDAGNWAPGGSNTQRWRFVVVQGGAFRERLVNVTMPTFRKVIAAWTNIQDAFLRDYFVEMGPRCFGWPRRSFEETMAALQDVPDGAYWEAPVIIFVIGPQAAECSLVCENMMLAAHSLGLGSCIVGFGAQVMDDPEIVAALEIEGAEKIHGPIVIGYPKVWPEAPPKKAPVVNWI